VDVLVQVNVSRESSKSGVAPDEVRDLVAAVADCPRLTLRGFMTIGLNSPDRAAVRRGYAELAGIRERAAGEGWPGAAAAVELSMGMSGDYPDAIAEGATIVRLGSAVFGARPPLAPRSSGRRPCTARRGAWARCGRRSPTGRRITRSGALAARRRFDPPVLMSRRRRGGSVTPAPVGVRTTVGAGRPVQGIRQGE